MAEPEVAAVMESARQVVIIAELGGGTGTGAALVPADIAVNFENQYFEGLVRV